MRLKLQDKDQNWSTYAHAKKCTRSGFTRFLDLVDPDNKIWPSGSNGKAKTFNFRYYMLKMYQIRFFRFPGSGWSGKPDLFIRFEPQGHKAIFVVMYI